MSKPIEVPEHIKARNIFANITFGPDVFDAVLKLHGKAGWNHWMEKIAASSLCGACSFPEQGEECEPVVMDFDFTGHDFSGRDLSDLNLGLPDLSGAILRDCDISGARLGIIMGADFTGCRISADTTFDGAMTEGEPWPIGLPETLLAHCKRFSKEECAGDNEEEPRGNTIRVKITDAKIVSFWKGYPEPARPDCHPAAPSGPIRP